MQTIAKSGPAHPKFAEDSGTGALRPQSLESFEGQSKTKERLRIMIEAAKQRSEPLRHVLLSGPPGLGKTTLALLLANEMGAKVRVTSGPIIEKASDLAGLLTSLEPNDLLFIDEIHRIPKSVEEYLYSAMEDFCIDIMIDQGPNARSVRLSLPPFTLVGATTRLGLLTAPLRNRFTLSTRLEHYSTDTLTNIVLRSCKLLKIKMDTQAARIIASRARGTPRIANNLIYFARDYSHQKNSEQITSEIAILALELLDIDAHGLDEMDKTILLCLAQKFNGGPVGLNTLATAVNEEPTTLEEVHEPYLIQEGFIQRTPQGRMLTSKAYHTLGLKTSLGDQKC